MRTITDHQVSQADKALTITVLDAAGSGGAHHAYEITGPSYWKNPSFPYDAGAPETPAGALTILFQNGPIPANGVNGITVEALLAICADRLRCFQAGPFASADNGFALFNLEESMRWLQKRTLDRLNRGVEGTLNA